MEWFLCLGLSKPGEDLKVAHSVIRELVSRQSDIMKARGRPMSEKLIGPFHPRWLSGSSINLGALLELCNILVSKSSGCTRQPYFSPLAFPWQ